MHMRVINAQFMAEKEAMELIEICWFTAGGDGVTKAS